MNKETLILDDRHHGIEHNEMCDTIRSTVKQVAQNLGMNFIEGKIEACDICGFFDCVCEVRVMHDENCPFRRAITTSIGIECDHGYDVCPRCDPCTCKE